MTLKAILSGIDPNVEDIAYSLDLEFRQKIKNRYQKIEPDTGFISPFLCGFFRHCEKKFSAGFRLRRTLSTLQRKPFCGLARRKKVSFLNRTLNSSKILPGISSI